LAQRVQRSLINPNLACKSHELGSLKLNWATTRFGDVLFMICGTSALSQLDFQVAGVARLRDSVGNRLNSGESSYNVQPEFLAVTQH
jgi:hypothetical protein